MLKNEGGLSALVGVFSSFALKGIAVLLAFALFALGARIFGGHDFGTFSILFSVAGLFSVFATAGQQLLLMRSWNEYSANGDAARLKGAIIFGVAAAGLGSIVTASLVFIGLSFFYSIPLAAATAAYLVAFSIALITAHVTRTAIGVGIGDGLNNIFQTGFPIVYLIACALGHTTPNLVIVLAAMAIGQVAVFTIHITLLARKLTGLFPDFFAVKPQFETAQWRKRAIKLWLSNGLEAANQYLDVLIVGALMSPTIAGAYFITTRLANAFAVAADAMYWYSSRQIPDLYYRREFGKLDALLNFVARINLAILGLGMVGVIVTGHWLLLVFNPDYQSYYFALVMLCFGTAAVAAVGPSNSLLMFTGHEGATLKINMMTVFLRAVGFLALVPLLDVTGAVIASTIAFLFMAFALRTAAKKLTGIDGSIARLLPGVGETPAKIPAE